MLQPLTNFEHSALSFSNIIQSLFLYLKEYNYGGHFLSPWRNSPQWARASRSHPDTPHSVRPLWTSDRSVAKTSTSQDTTLRRTDMHDPGGIRTRNPSKRAAADPLLRLRRHLNLTTTIIRQMMLQNAPRYGRLLISM